MAMQSTSALNRNRAETRYFAITILLVLFGCKSDSIVQQHGERADFSNYESFIERIADASAVELFEGLPSEMGEGALLKQELATKRTFEYNGYPFYEGALDLKPEDADKLTNLFVKRNLAVPYSGGKLCGPFHPDVAIEWTCEDGKYRALVCFTCHEILAVGPDLEAITDINSTKFDELRSLLSKYQKNRPPSKIKGARHLSVSILKAWGVNVHLGVPTGVKPVPTTVTKIGDDEYMADGIELAAADRKAISEIMASPKAFSDYQPKKCVFHADYALVWRSVTLLICLGCDELKLYSYEEPERYNLSESAADEIAKVLAKYRR